MPLAITLMLPLIINGFKHLCFESITYFVYSNMFIVWYLVSLDITILCIPICKYVLKVYVYSFYTYKGVNIAVFEILNLKNIKWLCLFCYVVSELIHM